MGFLVFLVVVLVALWVFVSFLRPRGNPIGEAIHGAIDAVREQVAEARTQARGSASSEPAADGFVPIPIEGSTTKPAPEPIDLPREPGTDHIPLSPGQSRVSGASRRRGTLPLHAEERDG